MKFDKDMVIKNRFWLILGSAVVLNLAGWAVLLATVPAQVDKKEEDINKKLKGIGKSSNIVNPKDVETAEQEAKSGKQNQTANWFELYNKQAKDASLTGWPEKLTARVKDGKYALEIIVHPKKATLPKDDESHFSGTLKESDNVKFKVKASKDNKDSSEETFYLLDDTKISDLGSKDPSKKLFPNHLHDLAGRPVVVTYYKGKFFGDKFTATERDIFINDYAQQFPSVFQDLGAVKVLDETAMRYETVVQFRYGKGQGVGVRPGGGFPAAKVGLNPEKDDTEDETKYQANEAWIYDPFVKNKPPPDNRFFNFVPKWDINKVPSMPLDDISEEIWIAQENLWVQRELFRRFKQANDAVASFPVDAKIHGDGKTKAMKLKNFYWEIELQLVNNNSSIRVSLKNLRPHRQDVGNLRFALTLTKGAGAKPVIFPHSDPAKLTFEGNTSIGAAGSKEPPDTWPSKEIALPQGTGRVDGIFAVDQVLTWETAAVKRIDLVVIGASMNGESALGHKLAHKELLPYKKKGGKVDEPKEGEPKAKVFPGKDAPDAEPTTTAHGLPRLRYLEVTPEARKLPVCLVLIVDPEHMAHVQGALLDSPLRFLLNQVMWQRYQGSLRPPDFAGKSGTEIPGGKTGPGLVQPATSSAAEDMENIELAIFGVITIYERPGRPQPAPAAPPGPKT